MRLDSAPITRRMRSSYGTGGTGFPPPVFDMSDVRAHFFFLNCALPHLLYVQLHTPTLFQRSPTTCCLFSCWLPVHYFSQITMMSPNKLLLEVFGSPGPKKKISSTVSVWLAKGFSNPKNKAFKKKKKKKKALTQWLQEGPCQYSCENSTARERTPHSNNTCHTIKFIENQFGL